LATAAGGAAQAECRELPRHDGDCVHRGRWPRWAVDRRRLAWAFAVWTAVGAFAELNQYLYQLSLPIRPPYRGPWEGLSSVWLWALMTPSIMYLARRFPLERGRVVSSFAIHVAAGFAYCVLDVILDALLAPVIGVVRNAGLTTMFLAQLIINLFSYVAVVAVAHAAHYHRMYSERRVRAALLESQLAQAQLRALEMQLHPHFLFNTLHSIGGLIRTNQHPIAIRMLAGLGELLRATLRRDGLQEVPLRDELALIERYLAIEQLRFGDRLRVVVDVEPAALDTPVPNLILQPLVENAVQHGLGGEPGGRVEIEGRLEGDFLCLRVRDSGHAAGRGERARDDGPGLGLSNTRARLGHLYGDRQRLDLTARPDGGTEALVAIPRASARPSAAPS
jgi:two-component system, LytTR family, sensor kinase